MEKAARPAVFGCALAVRVRRPRCAPGGGGTAGGDPVLPGRDGGRGRGVFSVSFDLPEGWTVRAREADAKQDAGKPLALASVASVYDLYNAQVTAEQQRAIASSLEFQE